MKLSIFLFVILICALPNSAFAYLDPGTGSYVLQFLIGGVVSAFFALKLFGRSLKSKISSFLGKREKH